MSRYDYTHNGVTRTVSRPATGCLYIDGVSIPPGATDAQLAALGLTPHVDPPPAAPVPRSTFSKLAIRRTMREQGSEAALDAILGASPQFRADWSDASEIDLADPVLVAALAQAQIDTEPILEALRK